jgi:GTPase
MTADIIMNQISTALPSTVTEETKNIVVKRDIIRKKEIVSIIFCGHVDVGKSTIERQLT